MSRSVPEWVGKTDDTPIPPRVRERVLRVYMFRCWRCGRRIVPGRPWQLDHRHALINGGENRERNLAPLCELCMPVKNAGDVAIKAKTAAMTKAAYGLKKSKTPMRGGRDDRLKRRMDGSVVDRATGRPIGGRRP